MGWLQRRREKIKNGQTLLRKLLTYIRKSCESSNKTSSTRIIAFILAFLITLISITIIVGGIYLIYMKKEIPTEMFYLLGALMTHQLTMVGINKHHESKQKKLDVESKVGSPSFAGDEMIKS